MPVYYYIDFYYDPEGVRFGDVVGGCVSALVKAGCEFKNVVMSGEGMKKPISLNQHIILSTEDIREFASAYAQEMESEGKKHFSFPPLGRIIFEYDFRIDDSLLDEVAEEESETGANSRAIGLSFTYSGAPWGGSRIKASLSLWDEYVLSYGGKEKNRHNMSKVLEIASNIYNESGPYFGAMNNEIALDTDRSFELLKNGGLPEGNEYAIVGGYMVGKLDRKSLEKSGLKWKAFGDGGIIIQFESKRGQK